MIKQTTLILGEGITEFFYLNSLKDVYDVLKSIKPDHPKNTSLDELEEEMLKAIRDYNRVFCIIDMDNKKEGKERQRYLELKSRYHKKSIKDDKKGIDCYIQFFETDRCTEVFFLYYFEYTTKKFFSYYDVEQELRKYCEYEKKVKFFRTHPLHSYFEKNGGHLKKAIENAVKSCEYKKSCEADCSYSEMGELLLKLLE